MKKLLLISSVVLALSLTTGTNSFAQNVGINSTGNPPDGTAMLDVASDSKGLLIPRVALNSTTDAAAPIAGPTTSLLVYNTATAGDVIPGFYYFDGSVWVALSTNSWSLNGNTGTDENTHFIGTTDGQAVVIKSAGEEALRATTDGNVEVNHQIYTPLYQIP